MIRAGTILLPFSVAALGALFHEPLRPAALIALALAAVAWLRFHGSADARFARNAAVASTSAPEGASDVGETSDDDSQGVSVGDDVRQYGGNRDETVAASAGDTANDSAAIRRRLCTMQEQGDELAAAAAETRLLALNAYFEAARAGDAARQPGHFAQQVLRITQLTAEAGRTVVSSASALLNTLDRFAHATKGGAKQREDS